MTYLVWSGNTRIEEGILIRRGNIRFVEGIYSLGNNLFGFLKIGGKNFFLITTIIFSQKARDKHHNHVSIIIDCCFKEGAVRRGNLSKFQSPKYGSLSTKNWDSLISSRAYLHTKNDQNQ